MNRMNKIIICILIVLLRSFRLMVKSVSRIFPSKLIHFIKEHLKILKLKEIYGDLSSQNLIERYVEPVHKTNCKNEFKIIIEISISYKEAKIKQAKVDIPYKPGAEWGNLLEKGWREYIDAISNNDMNKLNLLLENFFRNNAISGFWDSGDVFNSFSKPIDLDVLLRADKMMKQYRVWQEIFPNTLLKELEVPNIGNPWGYRIDGILLYEPVFEYHFQANYFNQLLSNIRNPIILEIGGGFGGLAYQIRKLNPEIKYIGFDLPENILLQSYYLASAFPDARIYTYKNSSKKFDRNTIDDYDIILLPNFELPYFESSVADLIINIRSLSEMPLDTIAAYFKEIDRIGCLYFFHENIYKQRLDNYFGIPSGSFPALHNFQLVSFGESKWPRYQKDSAYPCQENLFIKKDFLFRNQ
jgi:hypothetical protein